MPISASAGMQSRDGRIARAQVQAIATHVPEQVLSNETLAAFYPQWSADKIFEKTGIRERRIAAEGEAASDLAFAAALKLFEQAEVDPHSIDFLILCTQAPDYVLPTTACILQARLGLRRNIGAFDMNLGCSGFVYGLAVAAGLIESGAASNVLLLTADTYSKYINDKDKSVRTLFGDGAAATLVSRGDGQGIGPFVFGTDGGGAGDLVVEAGGFRVPRSTATAVEQADAAGNVRSRDDLFMHGGNVMNFSLREVPRTYEELLDRTGLSRDQIDFVVLHQANKFMLDALQRKLRLPSEKVPRRYEDIGNTVSSTIPFVLENLLQNGQMAPGKRIMLIGFGVGLSWAGTVLFC
jgi:3-oxoacyl-[acyl-carrier-protein] synthase-3